MSKAAARHFAPIDFKDRFPALDGIRAVAVVLVFFRHYGGGSHGGLILNIINDVRSRGWIGVDIFFVLSGFLITGILFDTRSDSQFFKRFFVRRSVRIFPIFYLVVALLLVLTPFVHYEWHAGYLLYLVYMGNFLGNYDFSYYGLISANHPAFNVTFGHFWSLCVEEQFYLLWPLVVWLVRDRVRLIRVAVGISVVALLLRILMFALGGPELGELWIVRTLPFRMDSLVIGGVLALLLRGPNADRWQRLCRPIFLVSGLLVLAIFAYSPSDLTASRLTIGFTLIALASAGLIGMTLRAGSPAFRFFYLKPLRILGKYSYGFYVYHLLFRSAWLNFLGFAINRTHSLARGGIIALGLNFIVSCIVAKLSYDLFESRFLRLKKYFEYDSELTEHKHAFTTR